MAAMHEQVTVIGAGGERLTGRRGWADRFLDLHPDARIEGRAERLPELPQPVMEALEAAGYSDRDAIDQASDEELLAVDGVGPATLAKLRAGAEED